MFDAEQAKRDLNKQILEIQKDMAQKMSRIDKNKSTFLIQSCQTVERNAKEGMINTQTNPNVTYGRRKHHPSLPNNSPAVDMGTLIISVTHSVEIEGGEGVGYVGSILKDPEYPVYLEYGTSKMKPRPWLKPAVEKSMDFMNKLFKELFNES